MENQTKDACCTGVGKSKGKELVMLWIFYSGLAGGENQEELITLLKQTSFVMISKSGAV
jgi:hypothetical protein